MMPVIAKEAAEQAVAPYKAQFVEVVRAAWGDWMASPFAPTMQCKRVRANAVWNQMLYHAKRTFDGQNGISFEDKMKSYRGLKVGNDIFIRMKKADQKLLSRNYPTRNALAFVDQTQDMFGGVARLELVYQLDKSETTIERVVLLQRHRKTVAWQIDLLGAEPDAQNVLPFAEPPTGPETGSVGTRIVKRKANATDGNQEVANA